MQAADDQSAGTQPSEEEEEAIGLTEFKSAMEAISEREYDDAAAYLKEGLKGLKVRN